MRLSIVIFDGFTSLDAIGGYEVLSRIPGMEVEWVAERRGVVAADTRRLGLMAFREFAEVESTDILYVPGGPGGLIGEVLEDGCALGEDGAVGEAERGDLALRIDGEEVVAGGGRLGAECDRHELHVEAGFADHDVARHRARER